MKSELVEARKEEKRARDKLLAMLEDDIRYGTEEDRREAIMTKLKMAYIIAKHNA